MKVHLAVEGRVKTEVGKVESAAALAVGGDTEGDTGALLGPGAGRPSLTYLRLSSQQLFCACAMGQLKNRVQSLARSDCKASCFSLALFFLLLVL